MRNLVWLAIGTFWVTSAVFSYRWHRLYPAGEFTPTTEDRFREALDHYLRGNWFEAEHVLVSLLRRNPRDMDAGLMLATMLRHTRRFPESRACLDRLERFDGSEKWELEIRRERELLESAEAEEGGTQEQSGGEAGRAEAQSEILDAA
jgi:hypothetical protein